MKSSPSFLSAVGTNRVGCPSVLVQAKFTEHPSTAADLVRVPGWTDTDDAGEGVWDLAEESAFITTTAL